MEQRIANWITYVVGGSCIATVMVIALIFFLVEIVNGNFSAVIDATTFKWLFWGLLYFVSIYLVSSLQGKSARRRLASWLFSVIFHLSLLSYVAIALEAGTAAFVIGIPETVVALLSSIGAALCIGSNRRSQA
jgi:hypothetical protein